MKILLVALLSAAIVGTEAFGGFGHRAVALIAERRFWDSTKTAVASILVNETIAEAAVWPDVIRGDPKVSGKGGGGERERFFFTLMVFFLNHIHHTSLIYRTGMGLVIRPSLR